MDSKNVKTLQEYFQTRLLELECSDHVRMLEINYACVYSFKTIFHPDKGIFPVTGNFQKYYMRLEENISEFELSQELMLKRDEVVLELLQHKIVKGRFVGIYKHEPNRGTLDWAVKENQLTLFDKYNYMISLVNLIDFIFKVRDPKNPFMDINLAPTNILLTLTNNYSIKLIQFKPSILREIIILASPEVKSSGTFLDKRKQHVFILGKIFYFICFGHYPSVDDPEILKTLRDYNQAEIEEGKEAYNENVIHLIRKMLNNSPVDRPSFLEISTTLQNTISKSKFFFRQLFSKWAEIFKGMQQELAEEIFLRNSKKKIKGGYGIMNKIKNDKLDMFMNQRLPMIFINEQRMKQFFFSSIFNDVNEYDKFGMIDDVLYLDWKNDNYNNQLKNKINLDRQMVNNTMHQRLSDALKKFNISHIVALKGWEITNKNAMTKIIQDEYLYSVESQMVMDGFVSLFRPGMAQSVKELVGITSKFNIRINKELSFPWQFVLIIILTIIVTLFSLINIYLRKAKIIRYKRQNFHVPMIF